MKLIKLKFRNLNALKGDWEIDFTDPAFAQDGIFAIIGDTGAGKTTILDAICLALYGKTPRLDKITESHNDIMNVQSSDCSAEATVETSGKRYHFSFLQRRARNAPQGNLQDPKREISEIDAQGNLSLLVNKLSQVEKLGIELLGMDFGQFTRSVMLAQGEFNKFLNAKPEERGELLEKITGTQIYSQIGVLAHQTHKTKKDVLDQLHSRLHDIDSPSDDDLAILQEHYTQNLSKKDTLANEQKTLAHQLALLTDFGKTSDKLDELRHKAQLAKQSLDDFERTHPTLTLAQKAQVLNGDFATLTAQEVALADSQARLHDLSTHLPELDKAHQTSQATLNACQDALNNAHAQKSQNLPIINQVQDIEKTLAKLNSDHQHKQSELHTHSHALDQKRTAHRHAQENLRQTQHSLNEGEIALAQTKNLETLHGDVHDTLSQWQDNLTGLLTHLSAFKNEHTIITKLRHSENKLAQALSHATDELDKAATALRQSEQRLATLSQLPDFSINALTNHLHHQDTLLNNKQQQKSTLAELLTHLRQNSLVKQLSDNAHAQEETTQLINNEKNTLNQHQTQRDNAKTLYEQSQKNHELLLQLYALQSQLDTLTDGTPCPLCGSLSHPNKAKKHSTHELDASLAILNTHQQNLNAHQETLNQTLLNLKNQESTLANLQKDFGKLLSQYKQMLSEQHSLWQSLMPSLTSLSTKDTPALDVGTAFVHLMEHLSTLGNGVMMDETISLINHLIDKLENLNESLDRDVSIHSQNLDTLHQAYQNHQNHSQSHNAQKHAYDLAFTNHRHAQDSLNEHTAKTKTLMNNIKENIGALLLLNQSLSPALSPILSIFSPTLLDVWHKHSHHIDALYALGKPTTETLDDFYQHSTSLFTLNTPPLYNELLHHLKQLATAQKDHQTKQHTQDTLKLTLNNLNKELAALSQDIARLDDDVHACQSALATLKTAQEHHINERNRLIGTVSLHDFKQSLDQATSLAQSAFDTAKDDHAHTQSHLDTQHRLIKDENDRLAEHSQALAKMRTAFEQALLAQGFANLEAYHNAKMDDTTLANLLATKDELISQHKLLQSQLATTEDEQLALAKRHQDSFGIDISLADLEKIEHQKHALDTALENLLGTLGADGEKLAHAKKTLAQKHALEQDIITAQNELRVWQYLNKLIGCSTGKSYRNYVQALSLNVLLTHANDTLHKISDRYTLVQSQEKTSEKTPEKSDPITTKKATLGIEVIDHHQGDLVRSSKNLSGGESFIISLALALGLSNLNSQKVQIESLFLDEGFGTLDEDALDTALNALSKIEQTGKTIGIISHVPALKERISTQIIAQKHSGGVSTLMGVGVSRG